MVKEDFKICLCETSRTALILPFTPSPWLAKILEFIFARRLKLLYLIDIFHIVKEHFGNCHFETPQINIKESFTLSPWLKKILEFVFVKRLIALILPFTPSRKFRICPCETPLIWHQLCYSLFHHG